MNMVSMVDILFDVMLVLLALLENSWHYLFQDLPGAWGAQVDPNQWSAYYGYGQGYDAYAYAYGGTQDPSLYAYGAYAGYAQYPQQARDFDALVHCI